MKKYRSRTAFQRALSALLCLSMVLSLVNGIGLSGLQSVTQNVNAEEGAAGTADKDEYANETLLSRWSDNAYKSAARPLYSGIGNTFGGL